MVLSLFGSTLFSLFKYFLGDADSEGWILLLVARFL